MLHKEFWGLLFLAFVAWILIAATPTKRIENACAPIDWTGNVVTSLSALVLPAQQGTLERWFDKLEYGCRYTTWRLFYQDEYNKWLESTQRAEAAKAVGDKKAPTKDEKSEAADSSKAPAEPASTEPKPEPLPAVPTSSK